MQKEEYLSATFCLTLSVTFWIGTGCKWGGNWYIFCGKMCMEIILQHLCPAESRSPSLSHCPGLPKDGQQPDCPGQQVVIFEQILVPGPWTNMLKYGMEVLKHNRLLLFIQKHKSLQLGLMWCKAISLGCLRAYPTGGPGRIWEWQNLDRNPCCLSSPCTPGTIYWISILVYSIRRVEYVLICSCWIKIANYSKFISKFSKAQLSVLRLIPAEVLQNTQINLPHSRLMSCWHGFWAAGKAKACWSSSK